MSENLRERLRALGFVLPLEAMEPCIRSWHEWMQAYGAFYDYRDTDGVGRLYEVHRRRSTRRCGCAASGVAAAERQDAGGVRHAGVHGLAGDVPGGDRIHAAPQATLVRAFGMSTGAWALWMDADAGKVRVRHYDARMVVPLT